MRTNRTKVQDGVVSASELYTIKQMKLRLGIGDLVLRGLIRDGLPVVRVGAKRFVSGRKLIEFLEGLGDAASASEGGQETWPAVSGDAVDRAGHAH